MSLQRMPNMASGLNYGTTSYNNHNTKQLLSTGYSLRSLCVPQLSVPTVKIEFARRAFRVAASQIWNDLPVNVQSSQSVHALNRDSKLLILIVH